MPIKRTIRTSPITKRFKATSCRACGGKINPKRICLDCNEPSVVWCENCFKLEDFLHVGHEELTL